MEELDPLEPSEPGYAEDWLADWRNESKLSEQNAYDMLLTSFAERLARHREAETESESKLWVVPFYYTHEDADNKWKQIGALWIPGEAAQQTVNYAGHFIHYVLLDDMKHAIMNTGIESPGRPFYSWIDVSKETPKIALHDQSLLITEPGIKQQVETDFHVQLTIYR